MNFCRVVAVAVGDFVSEVLAIPLGVVRDHRKKFEMYKILIREEHILHL
jgi:hypothetical protein